MLTINRNKTQNNICSLLAHILLSLTILFLSACTPTPLPVKPSTTAATDSASSDIPLIPEEGFARWRLVELMQDEQSLAFDLVAPAYLVFDEYSILGISTFECGWSGYYVTLVSTNSYSLEKAESTLAQCGADHEVEKREQNSRLEKIIVATTNYEINGNQLILSGESVYAVLELDQPE